MRQLAAAQEELDQALQRRGGLKAQSDASILDPGSHISNLNFAVRNCLTASGFNLLLGFWRILRHTVHFSVPACV